MRDRRRLRGRAVAPGTSLARRHLVGGNVDVISRRHGQAAARRHACAGHVDILSGAHRQPVGGGDGGRPAHVRAAKMHIARVDVPLLRAGNVVNAARDALQPHRFTADGGADVVDVPQRAQVQPAACAQQPGIQVNQAVAAVDCQAIVRRDCTAAVDNVTARQLDVITANHAAAVNGHILR
ncbi:hypothetical protein ENROMA047B_23840 [Enterobacter rongchengensis]